MGGVTDICSDKTGTLTQNRMTVVQAWIAGHTYTKFDGLQLPARVFSFIAEALALNIGDGQIIPEEDGRYRFVGSPTECAILVWGKKLGINQDGYRESHPKVYTYNFTSDRKRMSSVVELPKDGGVEQRYRLYCKGASEMVLRRCKKFVDDDGNSHRLNSSMRNEVEEIVVNLSSKGLRTVCLAYRDFKRQSHWAKGGDEGKGFEEGLTLIGVIGIEDPLRPEVSEAIFTCKVSSPFSPLEFVLRSNHVCTI